ncbi:MAG: hypothetical protein AB4080_05800 [Trichodesmium sp.]
MAKIVQLINTHQIESYHVRLNTYTLVEGRQRAEGRRQKAEGRRQKAEGFMTIMT